MGRPRLTFFCELKFEALQTLFGSRALLDDLQELDAGISMGILDLSSARAGIVKQLNEAGIPVTAWLLLPEEQGYWFNVDNASQAKVFYKDFVEWTRENNLVWDGIGFDIEPDIRELQQVAENWWQLLPIVFRRVIDFGRLGRAQKEYGELVSKVQADGYAVESYQFPVIVDERISGSELLRKVAGLVDLSVDREVLMLYTSFLRPYGPGVLWSYGRHCSPLEATYKQQSRRRAYISGIPAVGVGSTGGGVDIDLMDTGPLDWSELARDLRLAWHWCDDIYVFSLEGCVQHGYLTQMKSFDWDAPMLFPTGQAKLVGRWRRFLRSILWISAHPLVVLLGLVGGVWLLARLRRLASTGE